MHSIAIAGMGRMGANMALRLAAKGITPGVWNRTPEKAAALAGRGTVPAATLTELVGRLKGPRAVWMMLPAGQPTEDLFLSLLSLLEKGDLIIDGANGNWHDAVRRAKKAAESGIDFLDAGVSGGVWGLEKGYCIMTGGPKTSFEKAEPFLKALCQDGGYMHCGGPGAGHFTKMVHNGIEYAMMEAYGEGFELLKASPFGEMDMSAVAAMWNRGSVIRSWLLELAQNAFDKDPKLENVQGIVPDSGEGRWTVEEAARLGVPLPAISVSLFKRFRSQMKDNFGDKLSAALRREFGGHEVKGK
ncbi:MAG: 6-phosphogluconate dehydrogenase (decarboxylating) [Elusimicrobia bacterium GWA2_61_42]|nr:MAG: 6-phosphogluconate dehydrogenase (decarboxylating) [Elusimicrobia bacterium GWA2_61_42]OGR75217.1 MAG: 6-phosphogluconate dehydrogenase (decarboxylating) [Elusimicrobia bacterium GWC2_61_25]